MCICKKWVKARILKREKLTLIEWIVCSHCSPWSSLFGSIYNIIVSDICTASVSTSLRRGIVWILSPLLLKVIAWKTSPQAAIRDIVAINSIFPLITHPNHFLKLLISSLQSCHLCLKILAPSPLLVIQSLQAHNFLSHIIIPVVVVIIVGIALVSHIGIFLL